MTSDQIEPILFLAGDGSAEESAKTEKAVVFVQRDRGRTTAVSVLVGENAVIVSSGELARFENYQNVKMKIWTADFDWFILDPGLRVVGRFFVLTDRQSPMAGYCGDLPWVG